MELFWPTIHLWTLVECRIMPAVLFTVTLTSTHAAPLTKESIEEAGSSLMVAGWNTVHSFMRLVQFKKLNYVVEMVPVLSPTGLYRCDIQTIASRHFPTGDPVYVGLYPPNEGDVQILGDLALTVSSVLSGTNPLITLTCISTGGPATTVTWTRDSTTVTQGTVTVLDDPVTAQYTHTLTVSIEGDYTCTVSNNKPSTASASVTLRGPETPIVRVVSTTATSVTLSCIDPSDAAVISHVLHWQGDLPVACSDTNEGYYRFSHRRE
ncbi:hypothetical protein GBAR_LOCUS13186 [Geodia barretti]|uniref:Ig-like domain-containing protein n=1 Tax=Geodia barretti TaxID=519541 RepID=A0AA35WQ03_GEOBA|nr:hypothetical protein GBAR_LOCUS13186 [Geodia barretti]